ncbi:hypothetical protein HK098_003088 [Nowakowskiella sp. JEL0407]|nr:hypothetical protein HK098_003088 [Nowakowskiella sp. JEL0407]
MSTCNLVCSRFVHEFTGPQLTSSSQNFYGGNANCADKCPQVAKNIFKDEEYARIFGDGYVFGCFYGVYNTRGESGWYGISTQGGTGMSERWSEFPCPSSCVGDGSKFKVSNATLPSSVPYILECADEPPKGSNPPNPTGVDPLGSATSVVGTSSGTDTAGNLDSFVVLTIGVVSAIVASAGIALVIYLYRKRRPKRSTNKSARATSATSSTPINQPLALVPQGQQSQEFLPIYGNAPSPMPPATIPTFPTLSGFKIVRSLHASTFDHTSEQSVLDQVESLRDKIHNLASSVISSNPDAWVVPLSLKIVGNDDKTVNIAALKSLITVEIHNTIFHHFAHNYHHTIAGVLWEKRILHKHVDNPDYRIDPTGRMILEPEAIYSILIDEANSVTPADVSKIPDPLISNKINTAVSNIMEHLSPLSTPSSSPSMFKFAVKRIVREAILLVLKLKQVDSRYRAFLPKSGEPFNEEKMSRINTGERVAFCWGSGWKKDGVEGRSVIKVLAQVWVEE